MRFPLLFALALAPAQALAFCGFYVAGADTQLYNDATMVVLMRDGTKTVLSMQNNYQGPPEAFAMVVPVPQVLQKENVRTLPRDVFAHVDRLAAPRLVEYWEQDPCWVPPPEEEWAEEGMLLSAVRADGAMDDLGVKVEARFEVGEYEVVVLSAKDSGGLDTWLKQEKYHIPEGAEPVLRPYVEAGTRFFVARVNPEKVQFVDGRAVLSPLRMHYDDEKFQLPVRLGLLNSQGQQDLIVHILAKNQRYEVANYENTFIPTNLRVRDDVRKDFGSFYESLFTEVARPGTVVTEYAWDAGSCDPCPTPPLEESDILTLGGDVAGGGNAYGYTLTRLHYRYGADGLKEDLVFKAAEPVIGGRGMPDPSGELSERGAAPSGSNQFQGRYVILHRWEGEVACKSATHGRWGGPPDGGEQTTAAPSRLSAPAAKTAPMALASVLVDGIPGVTPTPPTPAPAAEDEAEQDAIDRAERRRCQTGPGPGSLLGVLLALGGLRRRR
ncbi:MAG: DUF2330 domain-containing protein [Alphaproteobacteria bacterium]|nr:DUF2330 domain-containing protein [Alphaproteobacteria bacterium]MCB9695217.1 DUF2330 domain-containing protein [Alphaproteobacteria bacterium]